MTADPPGRKPVTVKAACWLIFAVSLTLGLWALVTWLRKSSFDAAANTVFSPAAFPDADATLGALELTYLIGAVLSFGLAVVLFVLGVGDSRANIWARAGTWVVSLLALPFIVTAYVDNGSSYIKAIDTGASHAMTSAGMARLDALTAWRFSGWYHAMTIGAGVLTLGLLLAVIVLLALPQSSAYFRRQPDKSAAPA